MFEENKDHEQEKLWSPIKELPSGPKKKFENHWSTYFYEYVFTQIDEEKFAPLYDDGYSRPNKPVNELVSLEIIKYKKDLLDEELEDRYIFDHIVRNALGKEGLGDNICKKTFTNFRRRLLEYEEETGRNLLREVFEDHREHFIETFGLDGSTQRMDTSFIEANMKQLSRIDLIAKVVLNFLHDLPEERLEELPADLQTFADRDRDNLNLSYQLKQGEVAEVLETLVVHATWLVDHFENDEPCSDFQSFTHLQRVLDEQCYRILELEAEEATCPDGEHSDDDDDDDDDRPEWEPFRMPSSREAESVDAAGGTEGREPDDDSALASDSASDGPAEAPDQPEQKDEGEGEGEEAAQPRVQLKDSADIASDSLQNPNDEAATFRRKNDEHHYGYKLNLAETCGCDDLLRLITDVQVDTNTTEDTEFLDRIVEELAEATGLSDLLSDGGFAGEATEPTSEEAGVTQHFSGIKGRHPDPEGVSLADAEFAGDGHELIACPQGHAPYVQEYTSETGRYWGRYDKSICGSCPFNDECFVDEKQEFFSYGFYDRKLEVARHRAKLNDPELEEFLNLRAGAESMINEVMQPSGNRTKFTGKTPVENTAIATAIGINLNRAARALEAGKTAESAVA